MPNLAFMPPAEFLGTTSILAVTAVPNPLPPGSASITQPSINLNGGTNYLNLTVACWSTNFNLLVSPCPTLYQGLVICCASANFNWWSTFLDVIFASLLAHRLQPPGEGHVSLTCFASR